MKSIANIHTTEAKRIAKRLLNHWKHKFEVNESENMTTILMPDATLKLISHTDILNVEIHTDREDVTVLEQVVLDHLNRMAQQVFEVKWQHLSSQ